MKQSIKHFFDFFSKSKPEKPQTTPTLVFDRKNSPVITELSISEPASDIGKRMEGYWATTQAESEKPGAFPWPIAHTKPFPNEAFFIERLTMLQNDKTLFPYGANGGALGFSPCRCCDKNSNGSSEYGIAKDNFYWPQGYLHYIKDHHVMPSQEFYNFVIEKTNSLQLLATPHSEKNESTSFRF
jgi:hypothetical protein